MPDAQNAQTVSLVVVATGLLLVLARRLGVPSTIVLLFGGMALGVAPGVPRVTLDPSILLYLILPPILFATTATASLRLVRSTLRTEIVPGALLVLVPTAVVAVAARLIWDLPWSIGVLLGGMLSAAGGDVFQEVSRGLHVPRRIAGLLRGQRLVTSPFVVPVLLTALAVASTEVAPGAALVRSVATTTAAALLGAAVAYALSRLRGLVDDPTIQLALSVGTPFGVSLAAGLAGVSPLMGAMAAGFVIEAVFSGRNPKGTPYVAGTRLWGRQLWQEATVILGGVLTLLVGLALPAALAEAEVAWGVELVGASLGLLLLVTVVRVAVAFAVAPAIEPVDGSGPPHPVRLRLAEAVVVAWSGSRVPLVLIIAFLLPETTPSGAQVVGRDLIIALAGLVTIVSFVLQGATLAPLIRAVGLVGDHRDEREERAARTEAARAGLGALDGYVPADPSAAALASRLRAEYQERIGPADGAGRGADGAGRDGHASPDRQELGRLREAALDAERRALIGLHDRDALSDPAYQRLIYELDIEAEEVHVAPDGRF